MLTSNSCEKLFWDVHWHPVLQENISSHIAMCFIIFLVAIDIYLPSSPIFDCQFAAFSSFVYIILSLHLCIFYFKKPKPSAIFFPGINQFCLFVLNTIFFSLCFQFHILLMYILLLICFSYFKIHLWKEFPSQKCYFLLSCIGFVSAHSCSCCWESNLGLQAH